MWLFTLKTIVSHEKLYLEVSSNNQTDDTEHRDHNNMEQLFPRRNPRVLNTQLSLIYNDLLADDIARLNILRVKALKTISQHTNWTYPPNDDDKTEVMLGHESDWLTKLDALPHTIGVVYFDTKINNLSPYINNQIFNWSASNCDMLQTRAITKEAWSRNNYATTCYNDAVSSWTSKPLVQANMMRALPADYKHPTDKVTLTYIHVMKDAFVTQVGDVYVGHMKVVGHRCPERYTKQKYTPVFPSKQYQRTLPIYDEVFSLSQYWGGAYFHILVESLPRLPPFIKFLLDHPSIKVHIFSLTTHSYEEEFYSHFKIPADRFIFGDIRARVLYLPQSGPCAGALVFNGRMQSMIHRSIMKTKPESRRSIILIKRSKKRWFKRHEDILKSLQTIAKTFGDYQVEVFSDNPLPTRTETYAMFNRAFMVLAPHGGGESNLHFSEPGTILIEGLCGPPNLCYRNHMTALGHRYFGYFEGKPSCFHLGPDHLMPIVKQYLELIQNSIP